MGLWFVLLFLSEWLYGAIFETLMQGRTPGKLLLGLRVVRVDGSPAQMQDFVLRNLLRGVDFLPVFYGVAVLCQLGDDRLRRLGDMVAGTVVVREDGSGVLDRVRIEPPVSETERREMPARVVLTQDEIALIESFLRRRRRLGPARSEELARYLSPRLSERTGVEATSHTRVLTLAWARATGRDREPS
jgi:hypothetical protein